MSDRYPFDYFRTSLDDEGVLTVAFDRPDRRNAISPEMHEEMAPLFTRIATDRAVRSVVVTGSGDKAFCVGADFGGVEENLDAGYPDGNPGLMIGSAQLVQAQLHVPQPMIAAINGDALGLGATLALFCDMVFMADDARIGDPHVKAGIVAGDGGAILWPLLLGLHRGKEFLLTGDMMTAAEAYEFGLVNHIVPRADVLTQATALATRLARGARVAIEFNKRLANASLIDRVNRVLDASLAMEAITFETADHREAVRAFIDKREPVFGAHNRTGE
jgi:enoyl-CoA hydratase